MSEFSDDSVVIKFSCHKPDGLVFIIYCFPFKKLSKLFKLSLNNVRPCISCFPLKKLSKLFKLSLITGKVLYSLTILHTLVDGVWAVVEDEKVPMCSKKPEICAFFQGINPKNMEV